MWKHCLEIFPLWDLVLKMITFSRSVWLKRPYDTKPLRICPGPSPCGHILKPWVWWWESTDFSSTVSFTACEQLWWLVLKYCLWTNSVEIGLILTFDKEFNEIHLVSKCLQPLCKWLNMTASPAVLKFVFSNSNRIKNDFLHWTRLTLCNIPFSPKTFSKQNVEHQIKQCPLKNKCIHCLFFGSIILIDHIT